MHIARNETVVEEDGLMSLNVGVETFGAMGKLTSRIFDVSTWCPVLSSVVNVAPTSIGSPANQGSFFPHQIG
jgi:hypothetical protein